MSADNPNGSKRELDARLLALLRQDSRVPVSELAHVLNVSRAHVYASIARMEQDGTIDGYTVRLGEAHDRRMVRAHVMMTTLPKLLIETNEALALWAETLAGVGITAEPTKTGCCGMAGLFGHEAANQQLSRDVFALSWSQVTQDDAMLATGFSCRCQTKRLTGRRPLHPVELIDRVLCHPHRSS